MAPLVIRSAARAIAGSSTAWNREGPSPAYRPGAAPANHPNALLDPAVIWATARPRRAASSRSRRSSAAPFGAGPARRRGAIPVYRRLDRGRRSRPRNSRNLRGRATRRSPQGERDLHLPGGHQPLDRPARAELRTGRGAHGARRRNDAGIAVDARRRSASTSTGRRRSARAPIVLYGRPFSLGRVRGGRGRSGGGAPALTDADCRRDAAAAGRGRS